ncbi:hypothetical protein [Aquabacterium sp.]|uniref:hypothetical protein n=1 Tax=Aquabacterium sp. TaxID=1872578 RepID=UPI002CA271E6|nr:hypothetical protein [Aquabacterium sp.]HSW03505.1 hypothetical protein [Aquabacterium sp.]
MAEPATALLALWNDVDPALDAQYNEWHAQEHVPERLTVPGILWGRRYRRSSADAAPLYLTLYGLRDAEVLDSAAYQRLLQAPTPMSRTMRPALRNVSRWVCALHEQPALDGGSDLAIWTLADDAEPARADDDALVGACRGPDRLLAERLPQARPLPWLQAGQSQGIEGRWLVGLPFAASTPAVAPIGSLGAYARLPSTGRRPPY